MRSALLFVVLALASCRGGGESRSTPVTKAPPLPQGPVVAPASDPWAAPTGSDADAPPSLAERHKFAEAACPTVKAPFFFSIEKAGKVSHILGTRHISVPLAKFPHQVTDAIASAKLAVFEVDPGDDSTVESPKVDLPKVLGPELWKHYRELVGGVTADSVSDGTPAEAMIMMIAMYEDISAMLDDEIERQVQTAKIPTMGLETSAFQDGLLQKLLDDRMLKAEVAHTKDRKELADESKEDLGEYCAGTDESPGMDVETRNDMLASGYSNAEIESIDEQMVYARNADWIPKLDKLFTTQGDVFVAVGADHLIGPRGVVALLQKRGFTVKRIPR